MLEQICAFIHNYFLTDERGRPWGRTEGPLEISGGGVTLEGFQDGDYFLVRGSRRNDGIYRYPTTELRGDTLDGVVWEMRPEKSFLTLVTQIEDWQAQYGAAAAGPYQSESFADYSYSKGTATSAGGKSVPVTWQTTFGPYLDQWRKLA